MSREPNYKKSKPKVTKKPKPISAKHAVHLKAKVDKMKAENKNLERAISEKEAALKQAGIKCIPKSQQ